MDTTSTTEVYQVYAGLIVTLLGVVGWGNLVSAPQIASLLNSISTIIGLLVSVHGNYQSHQKITTLQGIVATKPPQV